MTTIALNTTSRVSQLTRVAVFSSAVAPYQVWGSDAAPGDVVARLTTALISADRS